MYKDQPPLEIDGALIDPNVQAALHKIVDYINAKPPEAPPEAPPEVEKDEPKEEPDDEGTKKNHRRR